MKNNNQNPNSWLDQYSKAVRDFTLDSDSVPSSIFNAWKLYPLYFDLWLDKIYEAITNLKKQKTNEQIIIKALPTVNSLRYIIYTIITLSAECHYDPSKTKKNVDFFIRHLKTISQDENIFNPEKNIIRNGPEVATTLFANNFNQIKSQIEINIINKLISVLLMYNNVTYGNYSTSFGVSYDGPYKINQDAYLLIKLFPNLKPLEICPDASDLPLKNTSIYLIYNSAEVKMRFLTHYLMPGSDYKKNILGYRIEINNQEQNRLIELEKPIEQLAQRTSKLYQKVISLSSEEQKKLFLKQQAFELKAIFDLAHIDWRPDQNIIDRIANKEIKPEPKQKFIPQNQDEYEEYIGLKYLRQIYAEQRSEKIKLSGTIANPGLVKGLAQVINSFDDFSQFKDGEVLVCQTTNPAFVPIMIKASGIITEKGGLTSHSAIVARELDIPCLVGVKNATKLIKNRDKIKLNANKGEIVIN